MNIAKLISENSARYSDKPAMVLEEKTYTYSDLDNMVKRYANLLGCLGVKKGDRIAIQLPKCIEFVLLHLANLSLGAITLPLNMAYSKEELLYFLDDSGSSLFFTDGESFEQVKAIRDSIANIRIILKEDKSSAGLASLIKESQTSETTFIPDYSTQANDVALMCYTSGTTGKPKAAMITHRNLISNTLALQKAWRWTEEDVLLHILPLFHVHGLCVALHGGLVAGSTIIIHEKFEPRKTFDAIEKKRCTMFMAVPTIYYRLMEAWPELKPDLSSMRLFVSGSAPLSEELFERFYSATGFRILERYGMTETQMIASNPYETEQRIPGSVGHPLSGVQIRIISGAGVDVAPGEIGEVWVKGENVFKGYWQMPERTKESFAGEWFMTGDLGYQEEKHTMSLHLVGRSKELIISGGYNIYPKEVEDVINQHELVHESAVIGISDREFGEKVAAAVVLKGEPPPGLEGELVALCKGRLASYKCPKKVIFLEQLPRNAMGKIQKHLIRF